MRAGPDVKPSPMKLPFDAAFAARMTTVGADPVGGALYVAK